MGKPGYKLTVSGFENAVLEYGLAKHAAQFVKSEELLVNYIQWEHAKGGPDIVESIRKSKLLEVLPPKPVRGDEFYKHIGSMNMNNQATREIYWNRQEKGHTHYLNANAPLC